MSTYIFGDVHGRIRTLDALLEKIGFADSDHAIFVGDLVNVGSESADVLRRVKNLKNQTTVLGNHDLHMLAVIVAGHSVRSKDTFYDVLRAPDRDDLVDWFLHQNMAAQHHDSLIIHAGVLPEWNVALTLSIAQEIESALQTDPTSIFADMYGNEPSRWRDDLEGMDRLRIGINTLTRCRVIGSDHVLEYQFKGEYDDIPSGFHAWFDLSTIESRMYFGHWSALGLRDFGAAYALDSGCAWNRELSCVRHEDGTVFQQTVLP
ncbi:MAG: symmetrical bis(5'-nucleosyl)-tetraphosphatase [bacterium]